VVAVSGLPSVQALREASDQARILDPVAGFDAAVPTARRFDPKHNVGGARATVWDQTVNVYGTAADSPRARRPLGNIGVQYGLKALQDGVISTQQFLDLNAGIGGLNVDLGRTARRTSADGQATRAAYRTGRLLSGGGGLAELPIIDYRASSYPGPRAALDLGVHSFVVRSRLIRDNGDADIQVLLTESGPGRFNLESGRVADAIGAMDRWITAVQRQPSRGHRAVVQAKPADLTDRCWAADGREITELQAYGSGECARLHPPGATPRMVAGGPLTADVISCALAPIDPAGYPEPLTADQARRLATVFPTGVCDWTRSGQWQRGLSDTWLRF
jgi:hypothetical protein